MYFFFQNLYLKIMNLASYHLEHASNPSFQSCPFSGKPFLKTPFSENFDFNTFKFIRDLLFSLASTSNCDVIFFFCSIDPLDCPVSEWCRPSIIHFGRLHLYHNYTSSYQFSIKYRFRDYGGNNFPLTPLIVASLLLTAYLFQTNSKSISYHFCLRKSDQLPQNFNQEYET